MTNTHNNIHDLSPEKKREMLAKLLQEKVSQPQIFPMSFAQQRLWFIDQLQPGNFANHIWGALRLTGFLNQAAFLQTLDEIVRRHEVLRTTFATIEEKPVQVIIPTLRLTLATINLEELSGIEQEAEVKKLVIQEMQQPFNLSQAPLLRATLLRLSEREHILVFTMHHIISDGWSVGVLIKEVAALYEAFSKGQPSPLSELPIQYVDFATWQRQWLQGEVLQSQISYWKNQLEGAPKLLELPTDYPRPVVGSFRGATYSFELSYELYVALNKLSQQHGSTLFMTLLAAFQTLLWRYTGSEDIVVGSPNANRDRTELEGLIGFFANTITLRTNLAGNPTFEELLTRVRKVALGAYAHQDLPFELLVEELQPERNLSYTPVFQVMFVLQNTPMSALELPGLTISPLAIDNGSAKFDLTLEITETAQKLFANLEFNTDLFEESTIKRMAGHFQTLLKEIIVNPKLRLSELSLLTEPEKHQLLVEWNNTEVEYPQHQCIHELFEAQVERTPNSIAVVFEDQQLTYHELNARANQLAHYLHSQGVKPEVLVGICVERSLHMVIGLLAILKTGGAYIPLDPSYPQERLALILEDAQAPVLLTQASLLEAMPQHKAKVVCLDAHWQTIAQQSKENLFSELTTDNLAYVIYTSGSTGKPKGVQIPHSTLSNFLYSMRQTPGLTEEDTLLAVTTISFDIAALELFLPIIVGGRLVVASREIASDATQLSAKLVDSKATVMQATPATWQLLLTAGWGGNHQLKIFCGGEALPTHLANQLLHRCASLWNMYGPTETTIWSAASQIKIDSKVVTISHPIANTQLYILDEYSQLVPVGVAGELHIGGDGLARGYFNRPDLTAEKFIPNPFSKEAARLYKTGDLARYLPNGEIEYISRIDDQVKLRGFRIELGEIETLITQHPEVQETVVVVRSDSADSQRIVAYVVPQKEQPLTIPELRSFLESKLPNYMVPAAFVTLEALPLTPNSKVDRKALPIPELTEVLSSNIIPPSTPIENLLTGIWAEVLNIDKVGIYNNFFELGGHSLIATRVISQIRQVFQVELPLRYLFEKPTIAGLAKEIEKAIKVDSGVEATNIERISRSQDLPLSFAQQRLWFLAQLEPNSPFYNIPAVVRLQGQLNVGALQQSFNEIISRHEALRTNFQTIEGQAVAVISEATPLILPIFDISELPSNQQEAEVRQQASQEAQKPFNLNSDLLLRVKLLRLSQEEHIILLTMHHIVSDGWSMGVLVQELATLYQVFCNGQPISCPDATRWRSWSAGLIPLPALPIQYVDFAAWQRQWLQGEVLETQISYWLKHLENAPKVLELPTNQPRPAIQTFRGATYSFELSDELSFDLNKLSQQQGSTLFMTLLAAFQTLLWRYTGSEDIVVGSPIANRNRAEIEGLIGCFVNTLVLRTNLAGNPSFEELLKRVREVALGAYAHQDLPFELLVEQLQPQRDLSHTPLFQVMFVLENAPMSALELPGLTLSPLESDTDSAKFDLTLQIAETDEGLVGSLEYNTDLFEEISIQRMAGHLQALLSGIVANPQQRLSELPLLTESEQHRLLREWNNTEVEYPKEQCIHELFETQVRKTPDAVAVVFEDEQLTYWELNAKANQLAHYLRSLGVKPEVLVGICVERSLDMVIGLLAILKAGGAYIPLDPSYPKERLAFILEDAQALVLLTQASLVEEMPQHRAEVVCLDADWQAIVQQSKENLFSELTPDNLAYVIYTSGSTGRPKGVMIKHRSTVAMLDWANKTFAVEARVGVLASTSICFDLSVFEVFVPLCCGGKVILIENALYLPTLPTAQSVTLINTVPSVISQLLRTDSIPISVQTVNVAGEPLHNKLVQQLYKQDNIQQVFNLYGPSEDTTYSTSAWIQKGASKTPPIGRPIHNTQTYLLDKNLQAVPVGVPGMLYIGGAGLARGYLNQPELTAEKFIPNPYNNQAGERLYKTGDLARYLPNGEIEYIGRIDYQVKVRGFRIELGEIEAFIIQHPGVREAVVTVNYSEADSQRLVAYVVLNSEQTPTIPELRGFLETKLPNYMVPTAFVILEALPLTPNGKVDRRALPATDTVRPELEAVYQPPQTEVEKTIAKIWQEVLNVENVGIHDNFFELGGHSLLLVQVYSKLQKIFQREFPLVEMFQYPTVSHLARHYSQESSEEISFIQRSHRPESTTASLQRRKQARKEHRSATKEKGVSSQQGE